MSASTRVLHVIDTYRIGGPGKTIINSAKYIDATRYTVHVASFTSQDVSRNEFANAVQQARIPYLALAETKRFNLSHIGLLRSYIKANDIRILHLHGYRTDVLGYVAAFRAPVAIVTTHHGWIRNNSRQVLFAQLALQLCRRFHGIELVSEHMRNELPARVRWSDRVAVVHNGIVLADYAHRGERERARASVGVTGQFLIGVVGRLSIEKGCFEMLDAFRMLHDAHPNTRLVFVGEGPLKSQMSVRIAEYGLESHVAFVPHQRQVQPYYEAFDMLVSPSRTEGLSNVILEALTFGVPVVATRVGGNAEILEDRISGLLVEPGQPERLTEAINQVMRDDALKRALVNAGHTRVRDAFGFDARMRKEESFYDGALRRMEQSFGVAPRVTSTT